MVKYGIEKKVLAITDDGKDVKYLIRDQLALFNTSPSVKKREEAYLKLLVNNIESNDYIELPPDTIPLVLIGDVLSWLKKIPSESI